MQITAKSVGLAAFAVFTASLAATFLITNAMPHTAGSGMIAQAEAQARKLGYPMPTPIPLVTAPPDAPAGAPHIVPLSAAPAGGPAQSAAGAVAQPVGRHAREHPAALQVAGNPHMFVGAQIRWTCVVDLIPEPTFADAQCGPSVPSFAQAPVSPSLIEQNPDAVAESIRRAQLSLHGAIYATRHRATIVLTGPISELQHGDLILISGTVREPLRGENAYGVTRAFPTVHIDAVEQVRRR